MLLQAALFLLSHFEKRLLSVSAEELMHSLNELAKGEEFNDEEMTLKFKEELKEFRLSAKLLTRLKEEKNAIKQTSEEHIIIEPNAETELTLYFKSKGKYYAIDFRNESHK